jgi:hypothetical protein
LLAIIFNISKVDSEKVDSSIGSQIKVKMSPPTKTQKVGKNNCQWPFKENFMGNDAINDCGLMECDCHC